MTDCAEVRKFCQAAGERPDPIVIDYTDRLQRLWESGQVRSVDEAYRPRLPNGFQYKPISSGQSGSFEPRWRREETAGNTYKDGSITVVAETISNTSLINTIQSSLWTGPDELTIDGEDTRTTGGQQKVSAHLMGLVPGVYRVKNTITCANGETFSAEVDIEIE